MDKSLIEMLSSLSEDEFVSFIMQCADAMSSEELNDFLTDLLESDEVIEFKEVVEEIKEEKEAEEETESEEIEELEDDENEDEEIEEEDESQEESLFENEEIQKDLEDNINKTTEELDEENEDDGEKENLQSQIKAKLHEVFNRNKKSENDVSFEKRLEDKIKSETKKEESSKEEITYIDLDEIDEEEIEEYNNENQEENSEDYVDFEIENLDVRHKISYIRNRGKVLHLKKGLVIKRRKRNMIHTMVKNGPEKYIDPICVDFCKKLWDKNVYTKEVKVNDNKVVIVLDKLSEDNRALYEFSKNKSLINNGDKYIISIDREGRSDLLIKNMLSKTVNRFTMQDVPYGYLDKEKFLMHFCNCEKVDGLSENSDNKNIKIIFDENKMEKTFEEYLKEKNLDKLYSKDNDRIYIDEYYLNGHKRYLEYMKDRL